MFKNMFCGCDYFILAAIQLFSCVKQFDVAKLTRRNLNWLKWNSSPQICLENRICVKFSFRFIEFEGVEVTDKIHLITQQNVSQNISLAFFLQFVNYCIIVIQSNNEATN